MAARGRYGSVSLLYLSSHLSRTITIAYQCSHTDKNSYSLRVMNSKELTYHNIIQNQLAGLYDHMTNNLLAWLPENDYIDEKDFTDNQRESIASVLAIEEEWILDPEMRAQVTLISWEESDDS